MLAMLGVVVLAVAWCLSVVTVLGGVVFSGRILSEDLGEDPDDRMIQTINLVIGLGMVGILSLAPLAVLVILRIS